MRTLHAMERGMSAYASLLQGCVDQKKLVQGKLLHAHIILTGFHPDAYLQTKLVIMYAKCARPQDARLALNQMPEAQRNVVAWTALIAAYSRQGQAQEALTFFRRMQTKAGIQADEFLLPTILRACRTLGCLQRGRQLHADAIRNGYVVNLFVGSGLVQMYAKCGRINPEGRAVFDAMAPSGRDVVLWNIMIAGYANAGQLDEALQLFGTMPRRDIVSWNSMIAGYAHSGLFQQALNLFHRMPQRDVVSWNALIAGYAFHGVLNEALWLFEKMPRPDVVSWNAIITGCSQNGQSHQAFHFFKQMQLEPNSVTFASILPACANMAALDKGREIHEEIKNYGFETDAFVATALVDMYVKCGSIEDARKVFGKMSERSVVPWSAIIVGYAMHGHAQEALHLFEEMQASGVKPNNITFVGVLSACCHAGLLADGLHYFNRMIQHYNIMPEQEHFCCTVDLLGRAGRLDEAHHFICKMPIKPDAAVWASLLSACRNHNNSRLGEFVAGWLFESNSQNAAHYVLMSNIYAAVGKWDDVEKVRRSMKSNQAVKSPGCSWIEYSGKVYVFT